MASSGLMLLLGSFPLKKSETSSCNTWDPCGATDQNDLVNVCLADPRITEHPLNGVKGALEEVLAQLLKVNAGQGGAEVSALGEIDYFDGSRSGEGECSFGTLAGGTETTESTRVGGYILSILAPEFLDEMVNEPVVEVYTT